MSRDIKNKQVESTNKNSEKLRRPYCFPCNTYIHRYLKNNNNEKKKENTKGS